MLLVRSRARVTFETGRVLERLVQRDRLRPGPPDVVPDVPHAPDLVVHVPEHGVVRMAGVAGAVRGDPLILKMGGGQKPPIVDIQALFERLVDMAGDAEFGRLGLLVVLNGPAEERHAGQHEKREKGK